MKAGAVEIGRWIPLTQEMYDAKTTYAKTTRDIEVLTDSLGAWGGPKRLSRKLKTPDVLFPAREGLGSREECWGETLMNFILIEHDVIGLMASTIRGEISGVRFFY